jgi:hypothetical protein
MDDSPFVHVDAALHSNHTLAREQAKHELPFVARHSADGESRDVLVRNHLGLFNVLSELTEPRPADDERARAILRDALEVCRHTFCASV